MSPIYLFCDTRDGSHKEIMFPAMQGKDGPPSFGDFIKGTKLRRLLSSHIELGPCRSFTFKASSQPPWATGAQSYDPITGDPCFSSRAEINKYVDAQNKLTEQGKSEQGGEILAYDACPGEGDKHTRDPQQRGKAKRPMTSEELGIPTIDEIMRKIS